VTDVEEAIDGGDAALVELVAAYPLPDHISDEVLNRSQIARALGTSDNTVTKWLAKGMPCLEEGGNGRDYSFQLSQCYAWRMQVLEEERIAKSKSDAAAEQMALLFRNDDDPDGVDGKVLSADEIIKESEADYRRNKAAEMRRELVRAGRVRELFEDILVQTRTQIVSLVDFAEMEFGLTPEQVRVMQLRCDSTLIQMRTEFGKVCPAEVATLRPHLSIIGSAAEEVN
jgi:phage terminase Nu1 subunit (DNA packaging protein)